MATEEGDFITAEDGAPLAVETEREVEIAYLYPIEISWTFKLFKRDLFCIR